MIPNPTYTLCVRVIRDNLTDGPGFGALDEPASDHFGTLQTIETQLQIPADHNDVDQWDVWWTSLGEQTQNTLQVSLVWSIRRIFGAIISDAIHNWLNHEFEIYKS